MAITEVTVNHTERNYFNDYSEIRSDVMTGVTNEKVSRAIDKLHRRYRDKGECDCMFVRNADGTGWRLMYGYNPYTFDERHSVKELRIRHITNMNTDSWDTEERVSLSKAKRLILGAE